jgi:hypothetical protein
VIAALITGDGEVLGRAAGVLAVVEQPFVRQAVNL